MKEVLQKERHQYQIDNLKQQLTSNTTLWELKEEFGRIMDFAPKFIKLEKGKDYSNRTYYTDQDNGKTMKTLGVKGGEYFVAKKNLPDSASTQADLANEEGFTPLAKRAFDMLFDMYAEDDGTWSKWSTHYFIMGCVGEIPPSSSLMGLHPTSWPRAGSQLTARASQYPRYVSSGHRLPMGF